MIQKAWSHFLAVPIRSAIFLFLLLSFPFNSVHSQNTESGPSILQTIKKLERKFDVRFSYNRKQLKKISCTYSTETETLKEALDGLRLECGLQFFMIDKRYIAIRTQGDEVISVCGTLIDTATGAPLAGASIVTSAIQIPTGAAGRFSITSISASEKISVYYQGFKVRELIASEVAGTDDCKQVFIEQIFNFLPTVELTAYLTKGISRSTEGTVSISDSNFEIIPSLVDTDVLKIAQILPGVDSFSETASEINIRGGNEDQSLLLWDDMRMYQTGHFFGLISAFNPNLTRNVNIYKNGTHPRFGTTVSGVISMTSDNDITEAVDGSVSIDFTSLNGFAKIPLNEKLAFHVSGRTSINTGLGNPVYNQFFDRVFQNTVITDLNTDTELGLRSTDEAFNFYDLNAKLIWTPTEKDLLSYSFLTIYNKLEFTERFTGETSLLRNDSELKQRTLLNSVLWERNWSSKLRSKIMVGGTDYANNRGIQDIDSERLKTENNEIDEFALKADVFYTVNTDISFEGGYHRTKTSIDFSESPFETAEFFTTNQELTSDVLYLNGKVKLFNKNTMVSAGVRFTQFDLENTSFTEPRINLFQRLNDDFSLTASYETKNQPVFARTQVEDNLLGLANQRWLIANPEVSPILESSQVSAGASYKSNHWVISLEAFRKEIDGLNTLNLGYRNQLSGVSSLGTNDIDGIEFSINHKTENLNAWFSYTYLDNQLEFSELSTPSFRSKLDISHTFNMAASYSWNDFLFSVGMFYHSGIPFTIPVAGEEVIIDEGIAFINFDSPNEATLREYIRADFSAAYNFRLDQNFNGEINVGLLNLFDRQNLLDTYYILENDLNGNAEINKVEQFSLGFTPNVALRLLF